MNEPQRIVLRQRRDLGQIVEATIGLYTQNLAPLLWIASVVIPLGIAGAAFQYAIDDPVAEAIVTGPIFLLQAVVSLLAAAAIIAALVEIDAGRPADFSSAYDVAYARLWTLIGAILRVFVIVLLFAITIIGIPLAIYRGVRWLFVEQAVILDGTSARAALAYSADGVQGSWWRTLGIVLLIGTITGIAAAIVTIPFAFAPPLLSGSVSAIVNAALLPFNAIALTLLYCDLQARRQELRSEPAAKEGT